MPIAHFKLGAILRISRAKQFRTVCVCSLDLARIPPAPNSCGASHPPCSHPPMADWRDHGGGSEPHIRRTIYPLLLFIYHLLIFYLLWLTPSPLDFFCFFSFLFYIRRKRFGGFLLFLLNHCTITIFLMTPLPHALAILDLGYFMVKFWTKVKVVLRSYMTRIGWKIPYNAS